MKNNTIRNMFRFFSRSKKLYYVIEGANWVIKWVGISITENIKKEYEIDARWYQNA